MSKNKNGSVNKEVKKKSNMVDDAYKKKSMLFCGLFLLVFIIAVALFLVNAWYNGVHVADVFEEERKAAMSTPKKQRLDTSSVEIDIDDNDFYYWTSELDYSYQIDKDNKDYAAYDGCTVHVQGKLEKKGIEGHEYYWICRKQIPDDSVATTAPAHGAKVTTTAATTEKSTTAKAEETEVRYVTLAITVKSKDKMPKAGSWVDAVGTVSVDDAGFACVNDAKVTVLEKEGKLIID